MSKNCLVLKDVLDKYVVLKAIKSLKFKHIIKFIHD
jgi:hypothetical protein